MTPSINRFVSAVVLAGIVAVPAFAQFTTAGGSTTVGVNLVIAGANGNSGSGTYGGSFTTLGTGTSATTNTNLTNLSLQAGDLVIVAHGSNKNTTSVTASAAFTTDGTTANTGVGTFTGFSSGSTGTQSSAWIFYSTVQTTGTASLLMTATGATTVSQTTWYYILRPSAGQTLTVATTDFGAQTLAAATGTSNFGLDFAPLSSGNTGYFGVFAAATNGTTVAATPSGWELDQAGSSKRNIYVIGGSGAATLTAYPTMTAASDLALAGIVVTVTSAVPEPSTYAAILGASALGMMLWRRRSRKVAL